MTPPPYPEARFRFWRTYLLVVTALFTLQAATWVFIGSFDPFGIYDTLLANALYGDAPLPDDAQRLLAFAVVPLGATTAGFFVLLHAVVRYAFASREPWAWRAVAASITLWFTLDSVFSIWHGATFNVLLVNIPCAIILAVALVALRPAFRQPSTWNEGSQR